MKQQNSQYIPNRNQNAICVYRLMKRRQMLRGFVYFLQDAIVKNPLLQHAKSNLKNNAINNNSCSQFNAKTTYAHRFCPMFRQSNLESKSITMFNLLKKQKSIHVTRNIIHYDLLGLLCAHRFYPSWQTSSKIRLEQVRNK